MTPADFEHFRALVRRRSGLALTADKDYLVSSRLAPIARAAGVSRGPHTLSLRHSRGAFV